MKDNGNNDAYKQSLITSKVKENTFSCSDIHDILLCFSNEATRNNILKSFKESCQNPHSNSTVLQLVGTFKNLASAEMKNWKACWVWREEWRSIELIVIYINTN